MSSLLPIGVATTSPLMVTLPLIAHTAPVSDHPTPVRIASGERFTILEAFWRMTLELAPEDAIAHINLGFILQEQGRYHEAIAVHQTAVQLAPDNAIAYDSLGMALAAQGRYAEAEAAHCKAIQLEPADPVAYINLAFVLEDQRRLDDADAAFQQAERLGFESLCSRF